VGLLIKLALIQFRSSQQRVLFTVLGTALTAALLSASSRLAFCMYMALSQASAVLRFGGITAGVQLDPTVVVAMFVFTIAIVVAFSFAVMANVFQMGARERVRQLGILKSVGATRRQIRFTASVAALIISTIGIPIGVFMGYAVMGLGIAQVNIFFEVFAITSGYEFHLSTAWYWQPLVLSALTSFFVILTSSQLPAYRIATISAIEGIRGEERSAVDVFARSHNTKRIVRFLRKSIGPEGALAFRLFQANMKNYTAAVVCLVASMAFAMAANTASLYYQEVIALTKANIENLDASVVITYQDSDSESSNVGGANLFRASEMQAITGSLRSYPGAGVVAISSNPLTYQVRASAAALTEEARERIPSYRINDGWIYLPVSLISADTETYHTLLDKAQVPSGSNVLINCLLAFDDRRELLEEQIFCPFVNQFQYFELLNDDPSSIGEDPIEGLQVRGDLTRTDLREDINFFLADIQQPDRDFLVNIVVPELDAPIVYWFIDVDDTEGFVEFARSTLAAKVPSERLHENFDMVNLSLRTEFLETATYSIVAFVYGFTALLVITGFSFVAGAVHTNIRMRARENAILKAAGMTEKSMNKTIAIEGIYYFLWVSLIGVPLGLLVSYVVYTLSDTLGFPYVVPWHALALSMLCVLAIVGTGIIASVQAFKKFNIIEVIDRADIGM